MCNETGWHRNVVSLVSPCMWCLVSYTLHGPICDSLTCLSLCGCNPPSALDSAPQVQSLGDHEERECGLGSANPSEPYPLLLLICEPLQPLKAYWVSQGRRQRWQWDCEALERFFLWVSYLWRRGNYVH